MTSTVSHAILLQLGEQYGLPLYIYDAATIIRQIGRLKRAFTVPHLEIRYACKALTTQAVLDLIYLEGCGMDTVSQGEMFMALRAGVPSSQISFTPSGVMLSEYMYALERGIHVHVDQWHVLEWIDRHYPGASVTLRFNPGIEAGGHSKLQVGRDGSKFGFQAQDLDVLKAFTDNLSLRISGVHMHLGSDIGSSGHFDEAYSILLDIAMRWKDTLQHVDVGGGFKIPYHPDDHALDMDSFGESVSQRFRAFCAGIGRDVTLILEPGKYLVSEAGHILMEVSGVRGGGERPMAFVASGFNHFVRPMNYDAYHHILNLSNPTGAIVRQDVVGYLCETDTFATDRMLPEIRQGDVLCLMNAGAYGYSMASNYNARPRPAEVMVYPDGRAVLIRRAETMDDLLQTDMLMNT